MPTDRELSEFLLRACHDLRTPLRAIRAHTELLQKRPDQPEPSLGFIVQGARKVDSLIDGIAAYANGLQTDPQSFLPTKLDVVLRSAIARLKPELEEAGAEVTYADLPRVNCHPDRMGLVFEQLLRNALQHRSAEPPRIDVAAAQSGGEFTITVRDNGKGVEQDELETIFRPFQKLSGNGAGMGLAISRAIVQAHGGKMHAECPPGGGFAVVFTLPA
jgi:signal transduction histidine kinase